MTKLFSMKTLAFAGAAAFALTLAAAPQADAAETTNKIAFNQTEDKKDNVGIEYAVVEIAKSEANLVDGKIGYYYSSVKTGGTATKWKAAFTKNYSLQGDYYIVRVPVGEIAKGKAADIFIATDEAGSLQVGPVKCAAAPKLKATISNLTSGPSITLMNGKTELTTGDISIRSQYGDVNYVYADVADLKDGKNRDLIEELQNIADLGGGTVLVNYSSDDAMTPSATAKLKISGVANAPKLGLKLAKNFSLNVKAAAAYRTYKVEDGDTNAEWVIGSGKLTDLTALFGAANVAKTGDIETLENNMKIQIKTLAKGKKLDSRIGTTTVYASAATPSAVNVEIKNQVTTGKNPVTNASITFKTTDLTLTQAQSVSNSAIAVLEYKLKGANKWITKPTVTIKNKSLPDEIYVRVKATDASTKKGKEAAYEAAGHVLTITVDKNDPEKSTYSYDPTK